MSKKENGEDKREGIQSKRQGQKVHRMGMPYTSRQPVNVKEETQKEKGKQGENNYIQELAG